jgi:hypothetical protein
MSKHLKRTVRTVRKELLFFPDEMLEIETAARECGLNASEWVRYVSLMESKKLLNAKEGAHR